MFSWPIFWKLKSIRIFNFKNTNNRYVYKWLLNLYLLIAHYLVIFYPFYLLSAWWFYYYFNFRCICQPFCTLGIVVWFIGSSRIAKLAQRFADSMVDPLCNHRGLSDGCGSHWNISWRIPLAIPSFGPLLSLLFLCMETSEAAILGYDLP